MAAQFAVQPVNRFSGQSQPVKRPKVGGPGLPSLVFAANRPSPPDGQTNTPPKEFTCFSYDDDHELHLDDRSLRWYYPPLLNADLSRGFEQFDKHDDSVDEHLDSLLQAIAAHEQKTATKIDAQVVTWRGMMTKVFVSPEGREG